MTNAATEKNSRLLAVLREGVAVVQMVFFKELRLFVQQHHPDLDPSAQAMLAGAVTNEIFGTPNPEPRFVRFREQHRAVIEQELLGLAQNLPQLRRFITDALRVQTLCDSQEGRESTELLATASRLGLLIAEREIPLPSSFMTLVRELGEQHRLITPPVMISPEDDQSLIH